MTVLAHGHGIEHAYETDETLAREGVVVTWDHNNDDPSTWGEDYHRWAREKPHACAVSQAQERVRQDYPVMHTPMGSEDDATHSMQHMLRRGGHPRADEGFVESHSHPEWGQSQAYLSEGRFPAVAIHHERWDYGTLAHEVAHHLHQHHDLGGSKPADDTEAHGPGFIKHYQGVVEGMMGRRGGEASQLLGDTYHEALGRTLTRNASRRCPQCRGVGDYPVDSGHECGACDGSGYNPDCPCGLPVELHPIDGWQHLDGSISHDGRWYGHSVADLMRKAGSFTPTKRIFGPTQGLDHRLWAGDHLKHDVRAWILKTISGFWEPVYGKTWVRWARVYFAGSEASEWTGPDLEGNNDFDVLVGVHYDHMREALGGLIGMMNDEQLTNALNTQFRELLIPITDPSMITVEGVQTGPWSVTWYCNADSWDITKIKPYSAYDVTRDKWAVRPPHLPDWSLDDFPAAFKAEARAVEAYVRAVLKLPEPMRSQQADALWRHLHGDRSRAFSAQGEGWIDPGNALEKWLDQAGVWEQLAEAHFEAVADPSKLLAPASWSNNPTTWMGSS